MAQGLPSEGSRNVVSARRTEHGRSIVALQRQAVQCLGFNQNLFKYQEKDVTDHFLHSTTRTDTFTSKSDPTVWVTMPQLWQRGRAGHTGEADRSAQLANRHLDSSGT